MHPNYNQRDVFRTSFVLIILLAIAVTVGSSDALAGKRQDSFGDIKDVANEQLANEAQLEADGTFELTSGEQVDYVADFLNSTLNLRTTLFFLEPHKCARDFYWALDYYLTSVTTAQGMYLAWLVQFQGNTASDDTQDVIWNTVDWAAENVETEWRRAKKACRA